MFDPHSTRIISIADGIDGHALLRELQTALPSMRLLKSEDSSWVRRGLVLRRPVIAKWRPFRSIGDRLKSFLGRGRASRQWNGALWLSASGLTAAPSILLARARIDQRLGELLLMVALDGRTLLEHLADATLPPATEHAIADAVGQDLARIVGAGRFNRDHKPSNLLVINATPAQATVAILDSVAILPLRPGHNFTDGLARMLASLMLEPTGCGCPPRLALRRRVLRAMLRQLWQQAAVPGDGPHGPDSPMDPAWESQSARAFWRMSDRIIQRHGDPRPRVNPLQKQP